MFRFRVSLGEDRYGSFPKLGLPLKGTQGLYTSILGLYRVKGLGLPRLVIPFWGSP